MKKIILSLLLVAVNFSFSQEQKEVSTSVNSNGATFYIKAGANMPSFTGGGYSDGWKGKVSYSFGVGLDINLSEKISLAPELLYYNMKADDEVIDDELTLSSISIPLLLKYNFTEKLNVEVGPQIHYITNVERTRNVGFPNEKPNSKVNDFDYGVTGGLSYFFTNKFGVNARYYLGLTEVDERPGIYLAYTDSNIGKISFASLSLVYKL